MDNSHTSSISAPHDGAAAARAGARLARVVISVGDIGRAAQFYGLLLGHDGKRVSAGRHFYDCGNAVLALYDPVAEGEPGPFQPYTEHIYISVPDLDRTFRKAQKAGAAYLDEWIETMPWGERCFYAADPFGNRLCFVDERTVFKG